MSVIVEPFVFVLAILADIYFKIVVIDVVLRLLIQFKVLEADNKYAKKTMELLSQLTKPVYDKINAKLPKISGSAWKVTLVPCSLVSPTTWTGPCGLPRLYSCWWMCPSRRTSTCI